LDVAQNAGLTVLTNDRTGGGHLPKPAAPGGLAMPGLFEGWEQSLEARNLGPLLSSTMVRDNARPDRTSLPHSDGR
jgi:hypothetical protein